MVDESKKTKTKEPQTPSFAARLFEILLQSDDLHVYSPQTTKYRNKITYSIPLPTPLSSLAQDDVNQVCTIVAEYPHASLLFREVMAKSTRSTNQVLVRITVTTQSTIYWKDDFVEYMTSHIPNLACLCYNETSTQARPTKEHDVHLLYGAPFVLETTPNDLQYQISPDTFCEVNHVVERLQYEQAEQWLLEYCSDGDEIKTLLVSGRDVSSFGLCFGTLLNSDNGNKLFDQVLAVQHCPLVHADAVANFQRHSHIVQASVHHKSKQEMVHVISQHCQNNASHTIVGVMTGGRKGLDPSYLEYLIKNTQVQTIVYNSCSTKSLIRDMEGLLQGFRVQEFRSYNFFPGTKYTASLTLLVRCPNKTLILPIGPAGVGKSRLTQRLLEGGVDLHWWQRDAVFSTLRNKGVGLNKTKQLVHQHLLDFLTTAAKGILYVDSTNGSDEARQLYVKQANADCVLYVSFQPTGIGQEVLDFLMNNTRNRLGENVDQHPSFPDTVKEQREKHVNILKGISYPTPMEAAGDRSVRIFSVDPMSSEDMKTLPFRLFLELFTSDLIKDAVLAEMRVEVQ